MASSMPLAGKVAVISGSSSGIGAAIARELSIRGANVVINYPWSSLQAQAEAVVQDLQTPGIVCSPRSIYVILLQQNGV
jgi:NAD(P)-dependent dehydrogenase (short-subunit alcohol dehydrogenase family)